MRLPANFVSRNTHFLGFCRLFHDIQNGGLLVNHITRKGPSNVTLPDTHIRWCPGKYSDCLRRPTSSALLPVRGGKLRTSQSW